MDTTIGASHVQKRMETPRGPIILNIWDTAGQERYRSLIPIYLRAAQAALICYDVTNRQSFLSLEHWIEDVQKICPSDIHIYIVGNKCDLEDVVPIVEAEDFAASRKYPFFRTSAKLGKNITELFNTLSSDLLGGDEMHQIVINITEDKKETSQKKCC